MDRIDVEIRSAAVDGNTLTGIAHVFGEQASVSGGGKSLETFAQTAFDRVLSDPGTDVRAFWQHDQRLLLGRQSAGTLRLDRTTDGLAFSLDLPDTSYAADLKALVRRGDLDQMSFGFVSGKYTLSRGPGGVQVRTHQDVADLVDISPVSIPAFSGTSVSLRGKGLDTESPRSQAIKARHRAMENK